MCLHRGACLDVAYLCLIATGAYACVVCGNNVLEDDLQPHV